MTKSVSTIKVTTTSGRTYKFTTDTAIAQQFMEQSATKSSDRQERNSSDRLVLRDSNDNVVQVFMTNCIEAIEIREGEDSNVEPEYLTPRTKSSSSKDS